MAPHLAYRFFDVLAKHLPTGPRVGSVLGRSRPGVPVEALDH